MALIEFKNISKSYSKAGRENEVLKDMSLSIERGEMIAVMGKSGSGKSTMLNIIGGLEKPSKGEYTFDDKKIDSLGADALAEFRRKNIGIVVQHFALIDDMNVFDNVALPLKYGNYSRNIIKNRVSEIMKEMELYGKIYSYPYQLSGGESQRVAIARAIAGRPRVVLADEPTGAVDEETGRQVVKMLRDLNREGKTVIIVTHDNDVASACDRIVRIKDGRIINHDYNL